MSQTTDAPAVDVPADEPTGAMMDEPPKAASNGAPQVHVHVNGANGGRGGSTGSREALHRMDGYSTTSEYIQWAERVRREHVSRHDAYLQHAAMLEQGIRRTSRWPWQIDKIGVARRASRPLRQNAGAELDAARRISASVRVLVALKDQPQAVRGRGFDPTK